MVTVTARLLSSLRSKAPLHYLVRRSPNPRNPGSTLLFHRSHSSTADQPSPRTRTPLQKQFETWTERLKPGFTPSDVAAAIRSQSDPDVALDLFRWTSHHRNYHHTSEVYYTTLQALLYGRRYSQAESLIDEILSGACPDPTLPLFNTIIRFCCQRRHLFSRAFDVFDRMRKLGGSCKPSIETYSMLFGSLLRRFDRSRVCYVYMHSVRSLVRQMKASGVIPDTFAMNLIIKAHSRCLEMNEAIRVFREMGLYGCDPNEYTYGYLAKGLCEKGSVEKGMHFYREMKEKGLVPTASVYMTLANSLSLQERFDEAVEVVLDMIDKSMSPDLLTSRTLMEGLCRGGREEQAFKLLELLRKRKKVDERMYSNLLDGLQWLSQDYRQRDV